MSYWSDRQDELYAELEKEEEKLKKRIADFYRRESRKLEGKISSFYSRYGENNIIEYRKLMEKLDDDDLSLLIEAMDDFAEKYPEYAHLMPIRENIYKLNRLEGLQTSIRMQQLEIGAINNQELTDHLTKQSYRAVNTAAEALGFGKNFYSINSDVVKMFVDAVHTNGKNYSERIWGNTEKLTEYLCTDMAQAFARGDSYQNIIKHMKERFEKVARNDMYRLIYTEGTYTMAHATMKPFEEDFEQYKVSTAGDSKVCQTCRKVAEQVFNINEKVSGTNFPPFHAWCRCTWEVYVEDWNKWMDDYVEKHEDKKQGIKIINKVEDDQTIIDRVMARADSQEKHRKDNQEKFFEKIRECSNSKQISEIATEYFKNKFNCKIKVVDLPKVDIDVLKKMVIKLEELDDKFNSTLVSIKNAELGFFINGMNNPIDGVWQKYLETNGKTKLESEIYISNFAFSDKNTINNIWKMNKKDLFPHSVVVDETDEYIRTLCHEYGHSILPGRINEALIEKGGHNLAYEEISKLFDDYIEELNSINDEYVPKMIENSNNDSIYKKLEKEMDQKRIKVSISQYASKSVGEFIAEAFSDVELNVNPKEYSRKVYDILLKYYGKEQ